jgi:hypothetical protein
MVFMECDVWRTLAGNRSGFHGVLTYPDFRKPRLFSRAFLRRPPRPLPARRLPRPRAGHTGAKIRVSADADVLTCGENR